MRFILTIFIFSVLFSSAKNTFLPGDSIHKAKKFKFSCIYTNAGLFISPSVKMTKDQLKNSWSAFSGKPYSNYMESNYSGSGYTGNSCFEIGASFYTNFGKIDSLHNRWQMQLGIVYLTEQSAISTFHNYNAVRLDTLKSTSGGTTYYTDRVNYNSVYITHSSDFAGINISETFTANKKKLFSFCGGIGLTGLIGINSVIHENSAVSSDTFVTADSTLNYNSIQPVIQSSFSNSFTENSFSSGSTLSLFTFYLTGGCNFRWVTGKKGVCLILNPMVRAGLKNLNITKAGNYTNAFIAPTVNLKLVFK